MLKLSLLFCWRVQITMGLTISLLQKFGLSGVQSLTTDRVFAKYFGNEVRDFETFHIAFLNVCRDFNEIMPGKHFRAPPADDIKKLYDKWDNEKTNKEEQKKQFLELMTSHASDSESENGAIVMTGIVAPMAAMVLKKSGENVPPLKTFRLHLIPNVVFVPSCTVLALFAVKFLQTKSSRSAEPN